MQIQFKHQKFQADAAAAVVNVFKGQPYLTPSYLIDKGKAIGAFFDEEDFTGWGNQKVQIDSNLILKNLQKIQRENQIEPSEKLELSAENGYNLTVEMETGVGKTYTYIKTMYELNQKYGWSKFIIVVPSIAIREGVYKSFQITESHFLEEYGKRIHYFIYNSAQLNEIDKFASDNSINAMIINSQAFNSRGKDARRIYMELDEFRSRKPIDIIAKTNPVLIIDEPQSVEGKQTKDSLTKFNALLTLRYSATHKKDSIYNMVYRLDAIDAYNKHLVKKIAVKGIEQVGNNATNSYVYLESINVSEKVPTATLQFDVKQVEGIKRKSRIVKESDNLYAYSNELEEYKSGFVVKAIDGAYNSVEFINGIKIYAGNVIGKVDEDQLRRIQIRETILSHIERERELFYKGIKVLSLFFIDEVANYREYGIGGEPQNGKYARMFEEEYQSVVNNLQIRANESEYLEYLNVIDAHKTHAGYFSVDGKGKMVNSKLGRKETSSDDVSAYELIMKNKELLLDRDPKKSPVRFIFSHSALREGWDNPNVFQICTLKQSSSEVRKRQEVGRGLRLCVNEIGCRMDENVLGKDVHNVNVLTVIASESYDSFAKGLQEEIANDVVDRPRKVTEELFIGKVLKKTEKVKDEFGNEQTNVTETIIDKDTAHEIYFSLIKNDYIDKYGALTDKYYSDKNTDSVKVADVAADCKNSVIEILNSIYKPQTIENCRETNIELKVDKQKLESSEFKKLWANINAKSAYTVTFDSNELVTKAVKAIDENLRISKSYIRVECGEMGKIESKSDLVLGSAIVKDKSQTYNAQITANANIKYDIVGKLVEVTKLTRKSVIAILQKIQPHVFAQFKDNPEEFILKAAKLINEQKATVIIEHITYHMLDSSYGNNIFTDPTIKGTLGKNAIKTKKHLYDNLVSDSNGERKFATELDNSESVAVYVKLPSGFFIPTPVGNYNPDWAIAFKENSVKHIYFVAETKGSMDTMELREIESSKIHCAKEHFKAISGDKVVYKMVTDYKTLMDEVMK